MRAIFTTLCLLFTITTAMATQPTTLYDEGVSRELAEWRKANIEGLSYELNFDLVNGMGSVTIGFDAKCDKEIAIDYRNLDNILTVNGKTDGCRLLNEHIIVPCVKGRNTVTIAFDIDYQSLNSRGDFVYTLLVPDRARTLFPCFDQPDLKATYNLTLITPEHWVAVSNTSVESETLAEGCRTIRFKPTEPLSTYLFSFVAGEFDSRTYDDGNHRFTAYYRETDPKRLAQLDTIFAQVAASLEWLEEYTGIPYPFAKYDIVILPGFQYGGMEHTGATLYNDTQMFLGENPTPAEELRRTQLIAHETVHMWFGDYVTMAWFDDVWCKEVFANYFAARMTEPLYPDINHALNRLRTYTLAAYNEDRTAGSTAISQELDNLSDAGLIYGQIIYNKAPIVMDKIVEIMGEEAFRKGIQEYLRTYAYGNATWNDIIAILDRHTDADLEEFSRTWVDRPRMPIIGSSNGIIGNLGNDRAQSFDCLVVGNDGSTRRVEATIGIGEAYNIDDAELIIPNIDGRGYGLFMLDREQQRWIMENMASIEDDLMRESLIIMLNECYEQNSYFKHKLTSRRWLDFLLDYIPSERNYLIGSTLNGFIMRPMLDAGTAKDERRLLHIAKTHPDRSLGRNLKMTLAHTMRSKDVIERYYGIWLSQCDAEFTESDYTTLAYELALRLPDRYELIYTTQLARISNPDRCDQFSFIMRGVHPDQAVRDALFASLMEPSNRRPEPWATSLLAYLNHHLRQKGAVKYIYPALEELREVQRTGDIFFPRGWVGALLEGHSSTKALAEVKRFFDNHPDYPRLLEKKILQAMWGISRNE